ncbi:MAG: Ku protein [Deltaproteobacteria bacterium]|nr:Ku protein [Deltaproteobacteria bacterium]
MAARAIWKGTLAFGAVSVPVKLYAAAEDRTVHFRLLHEKDKTPVARQLVHPGTGKPVPREETRRGYVDEEEGTAVLLDDEELEALEPEPGREVTVKGFLDPGRIGHAWYDRPYYLGPDGSSRAYTALARAMEKTGKEGFCCWTMRKKTYIGALRAENGYLKMITLRFAGEVIDEADLPRPKGRDLTKQELDMAGQLVEALEGDFNPEAYRDEHRERVMELIRTKARGEKVTLKKPKEKKAEVIPLTDMLKKSIQQAKKEKKVA